MSDREQVAERFKAAGLGTDRYINVNDGEKGTYNHDTLDEPPAGNYGIYANPGDSLAILDVDDYEDHDASGREALADLPDTLLAKTPHDGRHLPYKVETPDGRPPAEWINEKLDSKRNPAPSWGEVRVHNQYVVGPGSSLDGCDKEWCGDCGTSDGGKYELLADREIATIQIEDLLDVLLADAEIQEAGATEEETPTAPTAAETELDTSPDRDRAERVADAEPWIRDYLDTGADDRSKKDLAVCATLIEYGVDEHQARDLLESSTKTKVSERDTDYWRDTWSAARERADPNTKALPSEHPDGVSADESTEPTPWNAVVRLFRDSEIDDKKARRAAALALLERYEFLYVDTEDRLLKYHEPSGVFEPGGSRDVKRILAREMGSEFSTHDRNEIVATIQDLKAVDVETLNAAEEDRPLLCVENGVLDLDTLELLEHSPEYRFTQSIPVEYDPDAEAPQAEAFLEEITESEGQKKTLEEMMGAALHPEYLKSKFLFLFGEGANGKGVYFDLLTHLLGRENVEGRGLHELANERFAKADLHGKLANIGGDIDDRKLQNVGELKRLTSGTDVVTAERKYGQPFKFVNSATLFFAANEPPAIEDKKRSMARRLVPVHMPVEFVEDPDPDDPYQKQQRDEDELVAELTTDAELSGLLNLALAGMKRLQENGDVSLERGPMERLEHYQRFSDPIYRFATECLEKKPGRRVDKQDVYELYKHFSREEGHGVRHNSVFWREFKRVFHYEETQPRDENGNKAPRQLLGTTFNEDALVKYGPEKLRDKYGQGETESEAFDATPLSEAADALTGYVTVTAEIVSTMGLGDDGAKAVLKDESGAMDMVAWEGEPVNRLLSLEDEPVAIKNAEVREYEGKRQLTAVEGLTEIQEIQQGVGYTEGATPEDGQGQLDDADARAQADGGQQQTTTSSGGKLPQAELVDKIEQWVTAKSKSKAGAERGAVVGALVEDEGVSEDRAQQQIDSLLEGKHPLYEPESARLRMD